MQLLLCLRQRAGPGAITLWWLQHCFYNLQQGTRHFTRSMAPSLPRELTAYEQQHGQRAQPGGRRHRAEPYSGQDRY